MREETEAWLNRLAMRLPTQHATAAEAHDRLMLTKAFDLSARRKRAVALPIRADDEAESPDSPANRSTNLSKSRAGMAAQAGQEER